MISISGSSRRSCRSFCRASSSSSAINVLIAIASPIQAFLMLFLESEVMQMSNPDSGPPYCIASLMPSHLPLISALIQ